MGSQRARVAADPSRWERRLQYLLLALFGGLIVVGFAYEAVEAAERFGWIAYPTVLGTGAASFLLARYAFRAISESLAAQVRREQLEDDVVQTGDAVPGDT